MRDEVINEFNEEQAIKNLFFVETEMILGILEDKKGVFGLQEKTGNTTHLKVTEKVRQFCHLVILSRLSPEGIVPELDKKKPLQALVEIFTILYPLWEPEGAMEPLEDIIFNILSNNPEESYFSQKEVDEFLSKWGDRNSRTKIMKNIFARILASEDQRASEGNEKPEGI